MGDVIRFPYERTRQRKKPYWRIADLLGKKPRGHAAPACSPRGRVLMAPGQVWVEACNQRLWVIGKITKNKRRIGNACPHDVTLVAYRGRKTRKLAESTVRQTMSVWDIHVAGQARLMRRSVYAAAHGVVRSLFSFDAEGNRID